jgi:2-oxoglutarate dehydrogenase E2 component (dihydrolipoamide succinyltransferase)
MQMARCYAHKVVQVPPMAESISEGTLKQFSKGIGDYVEQDEELATIETDKIDVAVNAPEAGTIKEFLVSEEDTVVVGQDIIKLELGGAPAGGVNKADDEGSQKSEPEKNPDAKSEAKEQPKPEPKQESKAEIPKSTESKPTEPKPQAETATSSNSTPILGSREERRVCTMQLNYMRIRIANKSLGKNESHAPPHCRTS